jgi:hypothetical protein
MSLTANADGINGRDLGIIGGYQYALSADGEVYRRRASEAGTYGGWRWECGADHPARYPVNAAMVTLANILANEVAA